MKKENIFQTFRPDNLLIKKYVYYYYLDIKEHNSLTEYEFFPHFNNTISLYQSSVYERESQIVKYQKNTKPFQIFTPIRDKTIKVKQIGKVHRLVVVFKPFGINQFFKDIDYSEQTIDYEFFSNKEIIELFNILNTKELSKKLDAILLSRFNEISNVIIEKSLIAIFKNPNTFIVENFSQNLGITRKHVNRIFKQNVGVSIKKFQQIVLFRKTLQLKLLKSTTENFTEIAYEFKFCDQSHFNKIYKNFTTYSPKLFFQKGSLLGEEDIFWHFHH